MGVSLEWVCHWNGCVTGMGVSLEWVCHWNGCVTGMGVSNGCVTGITRPTVNKVIMGETP